MDPKRKRDELIAEITRMWAEIDKLWAEIDKLWDESDKLIASPQARG